MNPPRITILLINYNYGRYIEDAIKSALAQVYPNFGLCIVDAGSKDNSWEIINKYLPNINSVQKNNTWYCKSKYNGIDVLAIKMEKSSGPSEARNLGIDATIDETDAYAILDSDDMMCPNKLNRLIQPFLQYPGIGAVYDDYDTLNDNGHYIREYKPVYDVKTLHKQCIVHSQALILKQALVDCKDQWGYYDKEMRVAEDYDLWCRISEKYMIVHIPEPLSIVRVQSQNSTLTVPQDTWNRCMYRINEKAKLRANAI